VEDLFAEDSDSRSVSLAFWWRKADPDRDGILAAAVGGFAGIGAGERWLGGGVVDHDAAATYMGDDTGNTAFEVMVKFVGSANRTYDDRCGVIPPMGGVLGPLVLTDHRWDRASWLERGGRSRRGRWKRFGPAERRLGAGRRERRG
jgi:hypothetical protein